MASPGRVECHQETPPITGRVAPLLDRPAPPSRRNRLAARAAARREGTPAGPPPAPLPWNGWGPLRTSAHVQDGKVAIDIAGNAQTLRLTLDCDAGWTLAEEIVSALQSIDAAARPPPELTETERELLEESMAAVKPHLAEAPPC